MGKKFVSKKNSHTSPARRSSPHRHPSSAPASKPWAESVPLPLPVHIHILRHLALPPASKLSFFLAATPPSSSTRSPPAHRRSSTSFSHSRSPPHPHPRSSRRSSPHRASTPRSPCWTRRRPSSSHASPMPRSPDLISAIPCMRLLLPRRPTSPPPPLLLTSVGRSISTGRWLEEEEEGSLNPDEPALPQLRRRRNSFAQRRGCVRATDVLRARASRPNASEACTFGRLHHCGSCPAMNRFCSRGCCLAVAGGGVGGVAVGLGLQPRVSSEITGLKKGSTGEDTRLQSVFLFFLRREKGELEEEEEDWDG